MHSYSFQIFSLPLCNWATDLAAFWKDAHSLSKMACFSINSRVSASGNDSEASTCWRHSLSQALKLYHGSMNGISESLLESSIVRSPHCGSLPLRFKSYYVATHSVVAIFTLSVPTVCASPKCIMVYCLVYILKRSFQKFLHRSPGGCVYWYETGDQKKHTLKTPK